MNGIVLPRWKKKKNITIIGNKQPLEAFITKRGITIQSRSNISRRSGREEGVEREGIEQKKSIVYRDKQLASFYPMQALVGPPPFHDSRRSGDSNLSSCNHRNNTTETIKRKRNKGTTNALWTRENRARGRKKRRSIVLKNNRRRDVKPGRKNQQEALIFSNWGVREATQVDGGEAVEAEGKGE